MDKSPDAFRTISEVAEILDTPAHVLRFWESRFPQIRPVKRAGGRRYYRPADVALLTGIKRLLHEEGLTIRGVQKILREQGVRHVAGLTGEEAPHEEDAEAALEAALAANFPDEAEDPVPHAEAETAQIVALETALRRSPPRDPAPAPAAPQANLFTDLFAAPPQDAAAAPEEAPFAEVAETLALLEAVEEASAVGGTAGDGDGLQEDSVAAEDGPPGFDAGDFDTGDSDLGDGPLEIAEILPEPAAPAPSQIPASPPPQAPQPGSLAARIAALPPAVAAAHADTLRALRDRALALQERMAGPPY
jgi:DNA-binding transcriptional MerR regulator